MPLQLRRDTEANIIQFDPVLKEGEPLWDLSNKKLFIGDGQTPATGLDSITGVTSAEVGDVLAEILDNGTSPNINFVYDSSQSALNVSLDFTTPFTGEISTIVGFRGSLISDDSTVVFDSAAGKFVNLEEIVLSDFGPDSDNAFDIGSASKRFKSGNFYNVNVKDQAILEDIVINGLIKGDDSSIIYDSRTGEFFARSIVTNEIVGDLKGSVFGDDSTLLVNSMDAKIVGYVENKNIDSSRIVLSGTDEEGIKAGITIITDGSSDDFFDLFTISAANPGETGQSIIYSRSRGTQNSPAPLEDGDELLNLVWVGADAASELTPTALIGAFVDGNPTAGAVPGSLVFVTSNDSGQLQSAISIDSKQQTTFGNAIKLAIYANAAARDSAIPSPEAGMMVFVTDGDGAGNPQFQGYTGIAWVNLN